MNAIKLISIFSACGLLIFSSCNSIKWGNSLYDNYRVVDVKSIVHMSDENINELKDSYLNKTIQINRDKIIVEDMSSTDFKGCDNIFFSKFYLEKKIDDEDSKKYPGQEIYKNEISAFFLKLIDHKSIRKKVKAYKVNCNIAWGENPLIIIPVSDKKSYFITWKLYYYACKIAALRVAFCYVRVVLATFKIGYKGT